MTATVFKAMLLFILILKLVVSVTQHGVKVAPTKVGVLVGVKVGVLVIVGVTVLVGVFVGVTVGVTVLVGLLVSLLVLQYWLVY